MSILCHKINNNICIHVDGGEVDDADVAVVVVLAAVADDEVAVVAVAAADGEPEVVTRLAFPVKTIKSELDK